MASSRDSSSVDPAVKARVTSSVSLAGSELTPEAAQQFADVSCLSVDVESGPGAVDAGKEMTASDFGIDEDQASELVDLAIAYRCPELASK